MKLRGDLFCTLGVDADFPVTDAIVTPRRISIDWREDDIDAHLDATSRDGAHFKGHYGYPQQDSDLEFDLTLFKAKDEYLLFGTWCEHDTGEEGVWVFRLDSKRAEARTVQAGTKSNGRSARNVQQTRSRPMAVEPPNARPQQTARRSAQVSASNSTTRASAAKSRSKAQNGAIRTRQLPPPTPPPSAHLDHLLRITPDQFDQEDRIKMIAELDAAPLSAVFKITHNGQSSVIRSLAAEVYAKRYTPSRRRR